jgi:putative glutamine amidotransferase
MPASDHPRPLVAITSDLMIRNDRPTAFVTMTYINAVLHAGGTPVVLPPTPGSVTGLVERFDAFIFTGGDDPVTEPFNTPTHPAAVRVLPHRQQFETQLLKALADHPDIPVLGICLGMQMMGLVAGGTLNQHLPDTHPTHADHWEQPHTITSSDESILASGTVYSKHRQAMQDPGTMRKLATAHDDVIEAIDDPSRRFYLGVQWHPERTDHAPLGQSIFDDLVAATRS